MTSKCPICKGELEEKIYYVEHGHPPSEESYYCNKNHYSHEFLSGGTIINVYEKRFSYTYLSSNEEVKEIYQKVKDLIKSRNENFINKNP